MFVSSYIYVPVILIVLTYVFYKLVEGILFMRIISKLPGPQGLPVLGNILDFHIPIDKIFYLLGKYSKDYNGFYKLRSTLLAAVVISNPHDIEIVISGMKNLRKSKIYTIIEWWLNTGLLTSTGEKWHERRKILTPSFHFNILRQFMPTFFERSQKMAEDLDRLVDREIDVFPFVTKHTLLTICETAMGTNVEGQQFEKYREALSKIGELSVYFIIRPWLYVFWTQILAPKFYQGLLITRTLHKFSKAIIRKRQIDFKVDDISINPDDVYKRRKRLSLIDTLLYAKTVDNSINDDGIREEVDTFMFEGHDTTSSCISFTLMLLACNKHIQDKAVEELIELLPKETDELSLEVVNNMKYLERVIKESLRLYPSVPMIGRYNEETIITHQGYVIPPQTDILIRIFDMHRDPKLFPDPERFDPDRFLPENVKDRHPYAYIPFSAGPRNCIGQKFAMLELKAMIGSILRKFELVPVDTPETITLVVDLICHSKDGIRMKFRRRR